MFFSITSVVYITHEAMLLGNIGWEGMLVRVFTGASKGQDGKFQERSF